jgi:hypothetical protein
MDPEANNRVFGHQQFGAGHAFERAFSGLIVAIRAMASMQGRDVERFLPSISEMGAWPKAYSIYCALKNEQERPSEAIEDRREREAFSANEIAWNDFLREREQLIGWKLSSTSRTYLGLEENDLGSPLERHEKYGAVRRQDWFEVASRVGAAVDRWQSMSPTERRTIPAEMRLRQLEKQLSEKETTNEA